MQWAILQVCPYVFLTAAYTDGMSVTAFIELFSICPIFCYVALCFYSK